MKMHFMQVVNQTAIFEKFLVASWTLRSDVSVIKNKIG
jgi:hypothetical protein